ncbi:MAG: peroxidase family protein [Gemmataceae bacterium]
MIKQTKRAHLSLEALEDRCVPAVDLSMVEWRTFDGTGNNLANPTQAAAETRMPRIGYGAQFPDGYGDQIIRSPQRPNPRTISNVLNKQTQSVPSARGVTDMVFHWGQFITHDLDLTVNGAQFNQLFTGGVGDFRIPIEDPNDPLGPNPIPFNRSRFDPLTGTPDPFPGTTRLNRRENINSVSSYLDASMIYGSDQARADALRTFQGGKMRVSAGNLLPFNTNGLPNDDPFGLGSQLYLAGDVRANEQVGLTVLHTLFVREHNRLADRIASLHPHLNDEQIYQVARRIVGAQIQAITYNEYLPAVLGFELAPKASDAQYNPAVNAAVTNAFAHAVFRFGHSQINEQALLINARGRTVGSLTIRDAFFNPSFLQGGSQALENYLRGAVTQVSQETDLLLVNGVRNNLFGPPGAGGTDLAALDIQRGRDHGLPDYNTLRSAYGPGRVTTFAQISSDPTVQAQLAALFGNVNNIDPWIGALAEDHLPGSSAGVLIHGLVSSQFIRLRDGDRFFYTVDTFLQSDFVRSILDVNTVRLSDIIRWNTNIRNIQDEVFFAPSILIVRAPAQGARWDISLAGNTLSVVNRQTDQRHFRLLSSVSQVFLVGSPTAADQFNICLVSPKNNRLANIRFEVVGGASAGDSLNVFGTVRRDTFNVTQGRVQANNLRIDNFGIDRVRLVTLGGNDQVTIAPNLTFPIEVLLWFNPDDENP